jgi:alanine dehydrogenase
MDRGKAAEPGIGSSQANPALRAGLNIALGDVVHDAVADLYDLPLRPVAPLLEAADATVRG